MKSLGGKIIGTIILMAIVATSARAEVRVQAQVEQSKPIYAGSRFAYSIIVIDGPQPEKVELSPLAIFQPSTPSTQSQTSIVNGRRSRLQILTYQLLASNDGDLTVPSVKVTVQGKTYQTNPVNISIVKPGSTKQIDLELKLSTRTSYVGQPVIMTLSFYVWVDIVRAEQITNLDLQLPLLDNPNFYLENIDTQPKQTTQTNLPINGRNEIVYQDQVKHNGVNCLRIQFTRVLIPKKPGRFDLPSASVTADLAVSQKSQRQDRFFGNFFGPQYEFQRFGAQSGPLQLEVQALPLEGKPDDFYGLVGNYQIAATANPRDVNVGDPITLTVQISGSPYLKPVQWPELEGVPLLADSFKIPSDRSGGEIKNRAKVFTQTIRAIHDQVEAVPPIPLSFFDPVKGKYKTSYSKSIPLQVSPTRIVTGDDVETLSLPGPRKRIKTIREGLSANYTFSDALINQQFSTLIAIKSPAFFFLYLLPLLGLLGSFAVRYKLADSPQRQAADRRRKAYSHALKIINQASRQNQPSKQILYALKTYVADKFAKPAGALTAVDCERIIIEQSKDGELAGRYREIMEQTEASEYSPMAFQLSSDKQKEIIAMLARIEQVVK